MGIYHGSKTNDKPNVIEKLKPSIRTELEYHLEVLKDELKASRRSKDRNDKRVEEKPAEEELAGQPRWFTQWLVEGKARSCCSKCGRGRR